MLGETKLHAPLNMDFTLAIAGVIEMRRGGCLNLTQAFYIRFPRWFDMNMRIISHDHTKPTRPTNTKTCAKIKAYPCQSHRNFKKRVTKHTRPRMYSAWSPTVSIPTRFIKYT